MSEIHTNVEYIKSAPEYHSIEPDYVQQDHRNRFRRALGRGALLLGLSLGPQIFYDAVEPTEAFAATEFTNSYPHLDARSYNPATYDWWVDENRNGKADVTPTIFTDDDETISTRGYGYRNCTDGASYWAGQYTGFNPRGWGNANTWDDFAAQNPALQVKAGNSRLIEPGDIAQSDDGAYGHVGFVVSVQKNAAGDITAINTAELNKTGTGHYSPPSENLYATKNAAGNFIRSNSGDWDHFIDVNGINKGLHNEQISSSTQGADTDKDSIPDSSDQCPLVAGTAANNGCPADNPPLTADINGDGRADLVHIWEGGANTWLSNGDGTYSVKQPFKPTAYNMLASSDWRLSDANGDGKTDLLHLWNGGMNTWMSNGDGTYTIAAPFLPSGYSMQNGLTWEIADSNNDSKDDLLHIWNGGVNTWMSNGDGTYRVTNPYKPANYSMTGGIGWKQGDFNGDHKTDLLHLWNGGVNLWASKGDGTFIVTNPFKPQGYTMNAGLDWKTGDANGDGKTDLLHLWNGGVNTWMSNGDGSFTVTNPYKPINYSMEGGFQYKTGDFNGDHKTDIVHIWNGGVNTWINNGDGTYRVSPPNIPSGYSMTGGFSFVSGDSNGDGKSDLLHLWNGGINNWLSVGDGTYAVTNPYKPSAEYQMQGGLFMPQY